MIVLLIVGPAYTRAGSAEQISHTGRLEKSQHSGPASLDTDNALPKPFEQVEGAGAMWGYRYPNGSIAILPRYFIALEFHPEGSAAAADHQGWMIIDKVGHILLRPFVVDNAPDEFSEGVARFVEDNQIGFFDRGGRVVLPAQFSAAHRFSEGLAPVCVGCRTETSNEHSRWVAGRWGYIDRFGTMVISPRFDEARSFKDGRARVQFGTQWFWIDHQGRQLMAVPPAKNGHGLDNLQ